MPGGLVDRFVHGFIVSGCGVTLFRVLVYYCRTCCCTPVLLCSTIDLLLYVLLHCCTAVGGWSVGGGWVVGRWWVQWMVPGGLLDLFVRG